MVARDLAVVAVGIGVTAVWEFTGEGDLMKARVVSGHAADEATWRRVS